jgi:predicted DNA-binding protein with PD1-like motif
LGALTSYEVAHLPLQEHHGKASQEMIMKAQLIHQHHGEKTFAVIFDKGDAVIAGLQDFARMQQLSAAYFTAIGAFSDVTLGYFERERKDYKRIALPEQVEVLTLTGNIALNQGRPKVHAHVVVGTSEGMTRGGHLLEAHVWPTLEVVVVESPQHLRRTTDAETGLALLHLAE